jgi:hypothetical protein
LSPVVGVTTVNQRMLLVTFTIFKDNAGWVKYQDQIVCFTWRKSEGVRSVFPIARSDTRSHTVPPVLGTQVFLTTVPMIVTSSPITTTSAPPTASEVQILYVCSLSVCRASSSSMISCQQLVSSVLWLLCNRCPSMIRQLTLRRKGSVTGQTEDCCVVHKDLLKSSKVSDVTIHSQDKFRVVVLWMSWKSVEEYLSTHITATSTYSLSLSRGVSLKPLSLTLSLSLSFLSLFLLTPQVLLLELHRQIRTLDWYRWWNYLVVLKWNVCNKCLIEVLFESGDKLNPQDRNKRLRVDDGKWKSKNQTTSIFCCYYADLAASRIPVVLDSFQSQVNDDNFIMYEFLLS